MKERKGRTRRGEKQGRHKGERDKQGPENGDIENLLKNELEKY